MIAILILGFILRLVNLNQSLWLDEAIGALVVKDMSLTEIATKFILSDNHPPLYYLILKTWTSLFGFNEIALRMPSVLFALGSVFLVFKITKSRLAAFLLATSPLFVYYSQEARMYMLAAFLSTLAVYLYQNKKFVYFSFSLAALFLTDYVPVFFLPLFLIYSLLKKYEIKKTLLSYLPLAVTGILWLPIFLKQVETGKTLLATLPAWQDLAGGATFKQAVVFWNKLILGRISFYPKMNYYLLLIISSIPFLLALFKSLKKENLLFWLWFVLPLGLGFLTSFVFPAFIYFRFLYVVPAFYILVSKTKNKFILAAVILVNFIGLGIYYLDKNQLREDWRGAVGFVESRLEDNEVVVLNYPDMFAPYKWYSTKPDLAVSVADSISVNKEKTEMKMDNELVNLDGLYYFNYLEDLTDPQRIVRTKILNSGFTPKEVFTFNGIGKVEYLVK